MEPLERSGVQALQAQLNEARCCAPKSNASFYQHEAVRALRGPRSSMLDPVEANLLLQTTILDPLAKSIRRVEQIRLLLLVRLDNDEFD